MLLVQPPLQVVDFFGAFRHSAPYLFAGSAFIAFGMVAAALIIIRRRFDLLLIYFALFATLYGLRLWMQSDILKLGFENSVAFGRLNPILDFLMPIPAFLFFNAAGVLRKSGRIVGYVLALVGISLASATGVFGLGRHSYVINNVVVILAIFILIAELVVRQSVRDDLDFRIIRWGLIIFAAFALIDNIAGAIFASSPKVESIGFAALLAALGYVTARRIFLRDQQLAEIQKELDVARSIQLSILPAPFPSSRHFQVEARYAPMTSVAGDFYEYVLAEDDRAGLLIADVSGHGVPAAMIASMVKLAAASQRGNSLEPARLLAGMNAALCGNTQGQFVTAAYVYLEAASKTLRYSAAGHPPMLLVRQGKVQQIEENGLILGVFDFAAYEDMVCALQDGDRILLYTDGLIEASDQNGNFFGLDRLVAKVLETASLTLAEAADNLLNSAKQWSPQQQDDLTIILCELLRPSATH